MSGFDDFAEGFADGFVPVYSRRMATNEALEDDLLRQKIGSWDEEKEKYSEKKAADAKLLQQANGILNSAGGLPAHIRRQDALGLIASELKIYDDPKYVAERFADAINRGAFISGNTDLTGAPVTSTAVDTEMSAIQLSGGAASREDSITGMNAQFASNLNSMLSELPEDLQGRLTVYSGYRSADVQAGILANNMGKYGFQPTDIAAWNADVASMGAEAAGKKWEGRFNESGIRKFVALPGSSKHQSGQAADLKLDGKRLDQIDEETRNRIHEHAKAYGLTFRMGHEPWQVELDPKSERNNPTPQNAPETQTSEEEELGLGGRFIKGLETVLGLDKSYYINSANDRFKAHLESNGELALFNQVKAGTRSAAPVSNGLSYDTRKMGMDIIEPPALTGVSKIEDINAIRAQISAFGINVPEGYNAALAELEKKFEGGLPMGLTPLGELEGKDEVLRNFQTLATLEANDKEAFQALPTGYVEVVRNLKGAYDEVPDGEKLTRTYLATNHFKLFEAAQGGDPLAVEAFNVWKSSTMPAMLSAIEAANPEDPKVKDLNTLYSELDLEQRSAEPDQNRIAQINQQIEANLQATRAEDMVKGEEATKIVAVQPDGTWSEIDVRTRFNGKDYDYVDADGNEYEIGKAGQDGVTYQSVSEKEWQEHTKIYNATTKQRTEYRTFSNTLVSSMPLAARTYTIVDQNPEVTRGVVGAARGAVGAINEVVTGINLLSEVFAGGGDMQISLEDAAGQGLDVARLEQIAKGQGLETISSPLLQQRAIFEANMLLLTFQIGGLEGQRGNAMSNKDFERLSGILNATDPEVTKQLMREYFGDKIQKARLMEKQVFDTNYEGGSAAAWEQRTGISFFKEEDGVSRLEQLIGDDPNSVISQSYNLFNPDNSTTTISQPPSQAPAYKVGDEYNGLTITEVGEGGKITVEVNGQPVTFSIK
jgi:hypothetical protein